MAITTRQFLDNDQRLRQAVNQASPFNGVTVQRAEKSAEGFVPFHHLDVKYTQVGLKNIDWSGKHHKHQEWPAQLNRFFQIPPLAAQYAATKDERFAQAAKAYKSTSIRERHRHRFEVNNDYVARLERAGLVVSGLNPRRNLVEIVELKNHPWFVAVQFHPEFQSKPNKAHPLFAAFVAAAIKHRGRT